ncbi:MAG: NAD(+)/NADH kinase [Muribaculaceae bacterium]|nr:NAD(+)/NADH kinase [Muribaculaceae bacterium]MDE6321564.1 NAD(+)/NADH kinase [Muribaculaceae bacterium]
MTPHPMHIAVVGSSFQGDNIGKVISLLQWLQSTGAVLTLEHEFADYLRAQCESLDLPDAVSLDEFRPDLALSFGGDGTFLRAVAWLGRIDVPILGINTGHLGYLTAAGIDQGREVIEDVMRGDGYEVECRSLIELDSPLVTASGIWPYALNEVAVLKEDTASMIEVKTRLGDVDLATYHADGLIVATPTGSTAYNLSVGGPIIEPLAPNWVVTPIAAHTLTMRPLVLGDSSELTLTTTSRAAGYRVSIDGRSVTLPSGSDIALRRADFTVKVVQRSGHTFAATLRSKLLWGN